jgi:NADPH-dependent 2,4-dienoyl-CoA reductase/sulfur reductase-like enzyme
MRRDGAGALRAVALSTGAELACDLLLVAAGAEPAGELLGLPAAIAVDEAGRTALPDVYACGDAAAPWHPPLACHVRFEHWSSAVHQATTVARTILGHETSSAPCPYFWSDQFGFRLQHVGVPAGWTRVALYAGADALEAHYFASDDRLVAALLVNKPHAISKLRRELATEPVAA